MMDEMTLKVQMASQMALLRSMDAVAERDAAIERAEKAEAELNELKELYQDRVSDLEHEFNRAQAAESELEISRARTFAARTRAENAEAELANLKYAVKAWVLDMPIKD